MILIATIKYSCGFSYETVSCKNHELAKRSNCSKVFSESDKLVDILKTFILLTLQRIRMKIQIYLLLSFIENHFS